MGVNYFTLDGDKSSRDFGFRISGAGVFDAPARDCEEVTVPGRNGTVIFDNGRWENVPVKYTATAVHDGANLDGFRAWLMGFTSYVRLEDTYHPEEYRMAKPTGTFAPKLTRRLGAVEVSVEFTAKPQRFLKSGEETTAFSASGSKIYNATGYDAKPMIRVYGYGTIKIGSGPTVTIAQNSLSYIDLDCDVCDATCGTANANGYVTLSGDTYPTIAPGWNVITFTGNITEIDITPRWWTM